MFIYKKYGPSAGGVNENLKTTEGRALEPRFSDIGIDAQALELLSKRIDLRGRSILRCLFPIFSKFGAPNRRVALQRKFGDLAGRRASVQGRRQWRRGLQQPVDSLGAGPKPKAGLQFLTHRSAARVSMRQPQFLNDCKNRIIGDLLRASHPRRLR